MNSLPPGSSFFDHLSLWDATNGILVVHRGSTATNKMNSPVMLARTSVAPVPALPYSTPTWDDWVAAMLDPINQTGSTDSLSRNFHWGVGLVGLPGRAGLDAGLSLNYNSLVWTKFDTSMAFDLDSGFPSPGFRLGFPVIYGPHNNAAASVSAYLMISPGGGRVELRQIGSTNVYESADSAHLQLIDNGDGTLLLRGMDGTRWAFNGTGNGYRVTEIKDTNGNYLTITNDSGGRLQTMTDTLGRVFTVNYDTNHNPTSISQTRGSSQYTWVTFGYEEIEFIPNFRDREIVTELKSWTLPVLTQVNLPDGTYYKFDYNSFAQVSKVSYYAADSESDDHLLNYIANDLDDAISGSPGDVPRIGSISVLAENWQLNSSSDPQEVTTTFSEPEVTDCDGSSIGTDCQLSVVTAPDGTQQKTFTRVAGDWDYGLSVREETWDLESSSLVKQRWVTTNWTQDNTSVGYLINPRVTETSVFDSSNQKRTAIGYQNLTVGCGSGCSTDIHLPESVAEYAANATTVLRTTETDYLETSDYLSRRIIGLPVETRTYNGTNSGTLMAKTGLYYDESGYLTSQGSSIAHFDATNYGSSFYYRGNLTTTRRYEMGTSNHTDNHIGYNTTGSVILTKDAEDHETGIVYSNTYSYAYPTGLIDPDHTSATTSIAYDINTGQKTQTIGPASAGGSWTTGTRMDYTYDSIGRPYTVTNYISGANTIYYYATNSTNVTSYSTIKDISTYTVAAANTDGLGRTIATATELPGSSGGYKAQVTRYDMMGRADRTSNPTEISGGFSPYGDDSAGWVYSYQTYDWKGRPLVTTNQDSTTKEITYGGCGCAGGEVVTVRDEGTMIGSTLTRRKQMSYKDVLGRVTKVENYNWDGSTVYQTIKTTYNTLDQPTVTRQYAGDESGTFQDTTYIYDGCGRLHQQHVPEQFEVDGITLAPNYTYTTFEYNADDTRSSITDARGASTSLTYNNRHQVTHVDYAAPTGISVPADVDFTYDDAGNRTSMTDGLGTVDYIYDQQSRLTKETRDFSDTLTNEPEGHYKLEYVYGFSGLNRVTDSFGAVVDYDHDLLGQTTAITGSGTANLEGDYASDRVYRAWGALKSSNLGSHHSVSVSYNSRLQPTEFEIPGVIHNEYDYGADGRLTFSHDLMETDSKYDRSFGFDQVGRMEHLRSGAEARSSSTTTNDRIYRHDLVYDAMNHLTRRTGKYWWKTINPLNTTDTYENNRNTHIYWNYDVDGRLISDFAGQQYEYDAAGQVLTNSSDRSEIALSYDGDGRLVKSVNAMTDTATPPVTTTVTAYYLPSSLLGQNLTELDSTGQKKQGYVYSSEGVLAVEKPVTTSDQVLWQMTDAAGYHHRMTNLGGYVETDLSAELDPFGTNAELFGPASSRPPRVSGEQMQGYLNSIGFGDMFGPHSNKCFWNGMEWPCHMLGHGRTMRVPRSSVGAIYDRSLGKYVGAAIWSPQLASLGTSVLGYGNGGNVGWMPVGSTVTSGGVEIAGWFAAFSANEWTPNGETFVSFGAASLATRMDNAYYGQQSVYTTPLDVNDLKTHMNEIVTNTDSTCGQFIQTLIALTAGMNQNNAAHSTNVLELSGQVDYRLEAKSAVPGGSPQGGTVTGSIATKDATVYITPIGWGSKLTKNMIAIAQYFYTMNAIHETIHLSGTNPYSDEELGRAAFSITGVTKDLPEEGLIGEMNAKSWSKYWGNILEAKCPPVRAGNYARPRIEF